MFPLKAGCLVAVCPTLREALALELVLVVMLCRDFRKRAAGGDKEYAGWWKRIRGGPFVRPTLGKDERELLYRLMGVLPADQDTACAYVMTEPLGQRCERHLQDRCFACGGAHQVRPTILHLPKNKKEGKEKQKKRRGER